MISLVYLIHLLFLLLGVESRNVAELFFGQTRKTSGEHRNCEKSCFPPEVCHRWCWELFPACQARSGLLPQTHTYIYTKHKHLNRAAHHPDPDAAAWGARGDRVARTHTKNDKGVIVFINKVSAQFIQTTSALDLFFWGRFPVVDSSHRWVIVRQSVSPILDRARRLNWLRKIARESRKIGHHKSHSRREATQARQEVNWRNSELSFLK